MKRESCQCFVKDPLSAGGLYFTGHPPSSHGSQFGARTSYLRLPIQEARSKEGSVVPLSIFSLSGMSRQKYSVGRPVGVSS